MALLVSRIADADLTKKSLDRSQQMIRHAAGSVANYPYRGAQTDAQASGFMQMADVLPFTRHAIFDPDAAAALGAAYDKAIRSLGGGNPPKIVEELIATRIVAQAAQGERDPRRLCEAALRGISLSL
jgi:hypothetical protein